MPRGGKREGAGRPKADELRKTRALRATDDDRELIREFARLLKHGRRQACEKFLDEFKE